MKARSDAKRAPPSWLLQEKKPLFSAAIASEVKKRGVKMMKMMKRGGDEERGVEECGR